MKENAKNSRENTLLKNSGSFEQVKVSGIVSKEMYGQQKYMYQSKQCNGIARTQERCRMGLPKQSALDRREKVGSIHVNRGSKQNKQQMGNGNKGRRHGSNRSVLSNNAGAMEGNNKNKNNKNRPENSGKVENNNNDKECNNSNKGIVYSKVVEQSSNNTNNGNEEGVCDKQVAHNGHIVDGTCSKEGNKHTMDGYIRENMSGVQATITI